jgi:archaellum component FlaC
VDINTIAIIFSIFISLLIGILFFTNKRFEDMRDDVSRRFDDVNTRFGDIKDDVNRRFEDIGKRLDKVDDNIRELNRDVKDILKILAHEAVERE